MTSNICPFVCSNIGEFEDERNYLKETIFPKIKDSLDKVYINFDPIQIEWKEGDTYVKSGNLLRLLLHNINQASPFFLCLLGQQYGPHVEKKEKPTQNLLINEPSFNGSSSISWIEKNLLVASQTGYNHIINPVNYHNSFVDYQINMALYEEQNYPYYRFYYRQIEYLDEKFMHLSIQERKKALAQYEAENSYCDFKIKDLKMKIAKKGLIVKYYSSLEQLGKYVYDDYIEMIKLYLGPILAITRPSNVWKLDNFISNKLKNYLLTDSLKDLFKKLEKFFQKQKQTQVGNEKSRVEMVDFRPDESIETSVDEQSDDYLEILKLRHMNLSNNKHGSSRLGVEHKIFLIVGPRGKGKTAFMSRLYFHYNKTFTPISLKPMPTESTNIGGKDFHLFYFLQKGDYLIDIIINITLKMRSRYLKKDCTASISQELYDKKSIIEQFHASLKLGPAFIFIDGLGELETQNTISLNTWLPNNLENNCKFVITLSKSSDYYSELITRKSCVSHELTIFNTDNDYRELFGKFVGINLGSNSNNHTNNLLYGKFLSIFNELKSADHFANPLFIQLIAQEIFTFDKEIYKNHPVNMSISSRKSPGLDKSLTEGHEITTLSNRSSSPSNKSSVSTSSSASVNIINSYIEEVSTIREIIQKIIKRYIKKNNWSVDSSLPLSIKDNPGWVGDVLCLLALSVHGIRKESVMRILHLRGYSGELEVTDYNWRIFRMQFGGFIIDGLNGKLLFSHTYFKEAVQTLLLDGFSVMIDLKPEPNIPSCKKNISFRQKEIHSFIIIDILQSCLIKSEFDFCCQIENKDNLSNTELSERYLEIIHELIYHIYMVYDLVNLCKILSSFKVIHIFHENRIKNPSIWFDFCEFIKLTTNLETLRPILFSSFTIGLPQYIIEVKNDTLVFKLINQKALDEYMNKTTTKDSQNNWLEESFIAKDLEPISQEKLASFRQKSYENQLKIQSTVTISGASQTEVKEDDFEMAEFYEPFIDSFLDLNELIDMSKHPYGDTSNMLVINRALLLEDLMKHLEDKYFQENYSFLLFQIVNNIIVKNYPLNDTEKLKYSYLLQSLAKMSMQISNFESALKYLIKCIDILEDLFSTFHLSDIDYRYKNKMQVLQISNRLSFLNSSMALILLKMNNLEAAEILLGKAATYNSEKLNDAVETIQNEFKLENRVNKSQLDINEKYDNSKLFQPENLEDIKFKKKNLNNFEQNELENDDSGSYEAKYFFYFITGLFEVQQMNFREAKKYFELALDLSIKWFGSMHANTSKIYHYFGCFFSLQEMEFYNFRRSELYLRKALYIIEREKKLHNEQKLRNAITPRSQSSLASQKSTASLESVSQTFRLNEYALVSSNSIEVVSTEKLIYEKLKINEEENRVAEILFDLGLLLITFDSKLSKREAIDCLRRSLDIKVLIFGANHSDCIVIKKKLSEIVSEHTKFLSQSTVKLHLNENNQHESQIPSRLGIRSNSFVKNFIEISPKKNIENLRKQNNLYTKSDNENDLTKWIKQNSIIEIIPKKLKNGSAKNSESVITQTQTQRSFTEPTISQDNEFLQTSIYADLNDNFPAQPNPSMTARADKQTLTSSIKNKDSNIASNPLLPRPQSKLVVRTANQSRESANKSRNEIHSRNCRAPTAVSIDVHNTKTINGPHSCLRTLLDLKNTTISFDEHKQRKDILITTKSSNNMSNEKDLITSTNVKGKILRKIYYKSAWYDVPPGSSKHRFKSYVKVAPNA